MLYESCQDKWKTDDISRENLEFEGAKSSFWKGLRWKYRFLEKSKIWFFWALKSTFRAGKHQKWCPGIPEWLLECFWIDFEAFWKTSFFIILIKISLIILDFGPCQTLSKINHLELSYCESKLKYHKLVIKNYPSTFEWSEYHKL